MDLLSIFVSLVSGSVGGNISGTGLKSMSFGAIGNTVAGAIGGVAAVCGAVVTALVGFFKNKMKS